MQAKKEKKNLFLNLISLKRSFRVTKVINIFIFIFASFYLLELIPDTNLGSFDSLVNINPYINSNKNNKINANFVKLQPALNILRQVNPLIADWVIEKHENKEIVFVSLMDSSGFLAKFDFITGKLYISYGLFAENDGTVAVTLAHEYRIVDNLILNLLNILFVYFSLIKKR